jgi:hypothetical protein
VFVLVGFKAGVCAAVGEGVAWKVLEGSINMPWAVLPASFGAFLQAAEMGVLHIILLHTANPA